MTTKRPWFAVVDLQRFHTVPKTRTSWQTRSDLIDEKSTTGESQFNLEVCLAGSRGCAMPDKRVSQATTVQADMVDVVEFDLTRDSDLEAASERAQHQNVQGGESNTNRECPDVTQEQGPVVIAKGGGLFSRLLRLCLTAHDRRFRRVRQAMQCERRDVRSEAESIRLLAERVGPVHTEDIPMEIRRHQWSALNLPLLWAAVEGSDEHPFVGWLVDVSERVTSVHGAGVTMRGRDRLGSVASRVPFEGVKGSPCPGGAHILAHVSKSAFSTSPSRLMQG